MSDDAINPVWPNTAMRDLRQIMDKLSPPHWRVLIVDDSNDDRLLMRRLLEPYHCDCEEAVTADEAVEMLTGPEDRFDLCLLDMRLGISIDDGAEVIRKVRPAKPDMRFVIVSGYDVGEVVHGLSPLGVFTVLSKDNIARDIKYLFDSKPG